MANMTEREFLTKVIATNGIATDLVEYAQEGIAKLDAKNEKRKNSLSKTQKENEPIAQAIVEALAEGSMLGVDLATKVGCTVNKVNGVALTLVNKGILTKSKVKVKGKGDMTQYALAPTEEAEEVEEA